MTNMIYRRRVNRQVKEEMTVGDWKSDLDSFLVDKDRKTQEERKATEEKTSETKALLASKVIPAFEEVKTELEKHGRTVKISSGESYARIIVEYSGVEELNYTIDVSVTARRAFPWKIEEFTDRKTGKRETLKGSVRSEVQGYDLNDLSKEEIIQDVINTYKNRTR
jgi:hypothetical protein